MRRWMVGLIVSLASAPALAQESSITAAQAVAAGNQDSVQLMVHSLGEGYGWANAALILRHQPPLFCAPPERVITYDQHVSMLTAFVARRPAHAHRPVGLVLLRALAETFPC
jgi:hypothetical protein